MSGSVQERSLHEQLDRWVAAGLITQEQEERIELAEARPTAGSESPSRVPLAVEALGYVGGLLATLAALLAARQLWHDVPTAVELGAAAVGAVVLLAAAGALRGGLDPAVDRLRSVLWALSTGCVAAFLALLGADVLEFGGAGTGVVAAAGATVVALLLWLRAASAIQHVVLFAGVLSTAWAAVALADDGLLPVWSGVVTWVIAAAWGVAAHHGYVGPRPAGYLTSGVGVVLSAQVTFEAAAGPAFGLVTVGLVLLAGVLLRCLPLLGVGAIGVVMAVPGAAFSYLPDTVAAPLAIFSVGLLLLGIAIRLVRRRPGGR